MVIVCSYSVRFSQRVQVLAKRLWRAVLRLPVKPFLYFSCCASCGEIGQPVGKRLCTSLNCNFPIDIVVTGYTGSETGESLSKLVERMSRAFPWARRIHVVLDREWAESHPEILRDSKALSRRLVLCGENCRNTPEGLPGVAEHYIVVDTNFALQPGLKPLDFFTPNGIHNNDSMFA